LTSARALNFGSRHGLSFFDTIKMVVGEYAGGYGFLLPNPSFLCREHFRLRLEMEWYLKLIKSEINLV